MDTNADCTRLVVDGWLELEVREPEEALRVLSRALSLRSEWERLLKAQLGQSTTSGQGVSRRDMEKLSDGLVRFLLYTEVQNMEISVKYNLCFILFSVTTPPVQVSYSLQRLTALQTQNLYVGPQADPDSVYSELPDLSLLFPGAEAKPDPIKGGLRVTSFFTYNCLAVSSSNTPSEGFWC